jgi:hypothetical protein
MAAKPRRFDTVWANIPVFSGETDLGDAHEKMEDLVGFGVWVDDFNPASVSHRRAIDSLLRFLDSKGVCCVISGLYPAFMAGRIKLSPPASNTALFKPSDFWARLYISSDDTFDTQPVRQLLERGPASGEVKYVNLTITPLSADLPRHIRVTNDTTSINVMCMSVRSARPCGPTSNLNLMNHLWQTYLFSFYKYGALILPPLSHVLFIKDLKAKSDGWQTGACGPCAA